MSREEMLELVRDLERAGVRIERTERQPYPCEYLWQIVCWCENPAHFYTIANDALSVGRACRDDAGVAEGFARLTGGRQ